MDKLILTMRFAASAYQFSFEKSFFSIFAIRINQIERHLSSFHRNLPTHNYRKKTKQN